MKQTIALLRTVRDRIAAAETRLERLKAREAELVEQLGAEKAELEEALKEA